MNNFIDLLRKLERQSVEFVLVGGFGAVSLGSTLVTRDVDVVVRAERQNWVRVWRALRDHQPVHRMTPEKLLFTEEQAGREGLKNLYLGTDLGQLDCLGEVTGVGDYETCVARSEEIRIGDVNIRVLSLDAMIDSKRAMGRPRDMHTVLELEAVRQRLREGR